MAPKFGRKGRVGEEREREKGEREWWREHRRKEVRRGEGIGLAESRGEGRVTKGRIKEGMGGEEKERMGGYGKGKGEGNEGERTGGEGRKTEGERREGNGTLAH